MTLGDRGKVNLDFPPAVDAKRAQPTLAKGRSIASDRQPRISRFIKIWRNLAGFIRCRPR
jgi:hypothetical protein